MAKKRVYELAKELGVGNKEILTELENADMAVKSHSSSLEDEQVEYVTRKLSGQAGAADATAGRARKPTPRPTVRPAGVMRKIRPTAAPGASDEDMPAMPAAAKRVPTKVIESEKEAEQQHKEESYENKILGAAEVVVVAPEAVTQSEQEEASAEGAAATSAPEATMPTEAPEPAEAHAAPEDVSVEQPAAVEMKPEPGPAVEQTAAVQAPAPAKAETPAPVAEDESVNRPLSAEPNILSRPITELVSDRPKIEYPKINLEKPVEKVEAKAREKAEAKPEDAATAAAADKKHKKKKGTAEEEAEGDRPKKPKMKPAKGGVVDPEILEGIERVPVIPAKLKERLQPVKKTFVDMGSQTADGRKGQSKWAGKTGKKKGKMRFAPTQQDGMDEQAGTVARKKAVKITEGMSIKDFSDRIGRKSGEVLKKLIEMGTMATINMPIDPDAAVIIADAFGLKVEITPITDDEAFVEEVEDSAEDLKPRPPVVTIMGHVDHGKTSLLDTIRKTNVTAGEAGGITQHIGAYKVTLEDKEIAFLDTPGHEAFTAMRARGAQITDIVVLVVAADDGVKPQTIEAINHSKAAGVPIIVAVNKIDKPEADQDKVKRELADHGLVPEDWGGETIFVPVSAKQKTGIENLLEMILLQADVMELKANPGKMGRGTIVEAKLDKGRGPVATVLVSTGTLRQGDAFVTGQHFGRIRFLLNDKGKKVKEATPSTPVEIIGLSGVPAAGDAFVVMEDEKRARMVAQTRMQKQREVELSQRKRVSLEDLFSQIQQGEVKELNIIIKADVQGSAEAVADSLGKLSTDQVKLNTIHASVGAITESDVMLASASNAIIIGFNIRPEPKASSLAEAEDVDIRLYNVIYNAIDEVKAAMEGLLEPTFKEKVIGRAEVRDTFSVPKVGIIAGSYILDGMISRNCAGVRVIRDNVVVFEGKLGSLRRFKDDVKEVLTGYECGIGVQNFNDIKVGDIIEAYIIEEFASKL